MTAAVDVASDDAGQSVNDLVTAAARHLRQGEVEATHQALAAAAGREPNFMPLHFVAALAARRMGDFAEALKLAKACLEQAPTNGTAAELVATFYAEIGNLAESAYHGKLATALGPDPYLASLVPPDFPTFEDSFLAIQSRPLFAHAKFFHAQGQDHLAIDRAEQQIRVAPEDDEARQFCLDLLLQSGLAAKAVEVMRSRDEETPPTPALLSLYARALTASGEFAEARRRHDDARRAAPKDAAIAAARLADARWLGEAKSNIALHASKWAKQFTKPSRSAVRREPTGKITIGYLVSRFADRKDAAAVAAVARAHDREGFRTIGYAMGAQTWNRNMAMSGAFGLWRDVSGLDPATLARTLSGDGLDVVIDVGGFEAPAHLQALAGLSSAIRVAWLHDPSGLETIFDAAIVGGGGFDSGTIRAWPVGWGGYPLLGDGGKPAQGTGDSDAGRRFGGDIGPCQLGPETIALWSSILRAAPSASLLLRDNDMSAPENVNRLIERFGRDLAARIDVVTAATAGEFLRQVDVALAPASGATPRLVAEALAHGVPAIALRGNLYGDMLCELGLDESLVSGGADDYAMKATDLASSAAALKRARQAASAAAIRGEDSPRAIASAIEKHAREALTGISP